MSDDTELAEGSVPADTTVIPDDLRVTNASSALAWSSEEPDTDDFAEEGPEPRLNRRHRELLKWLRPDDVV